MPQPRSSPMLIPLLTLLLPTTIFTVEPTQKKIEIKTLNQKDSHIFDQTNTYINHLGKQSELTSEDINIGTQLLTSYIPILFNDQIAERPQYLYLKRKIAKNDALTFVKVWSKFFKELCAYREKNVAKPTQKLKKATIKIIKYTQTLRKLFPFGTIDQKHLLKYAAYCSPKVDELKERANALQEKAFKLFDQEQLNGKPIPKPKQLYGLALIQDIEHMLNQTEKNFTLKQAALFFNGPHLWLINILNKNIVAKSRMKQIGKAARQETYLKEKMKNILIRLCEEQEFDGLMYLFSGSSDLLMLKNKQNQTLREYIKSDDNKAAYQTLKSFHFGKHYKYRYNKPNPSKKETSIALPPLEQDE